MIMMKGNRVLLPQSLLSSQSQLQRPCPSQAPWYIGGIFIPILSVATWVGWRVKWPNQAQKSKPSLIGIYCQPHHLLFHLQIPRDTNYWWNTISRLILLIERESMAVSIYWKDAMSMTTFLRLVTPTSNHMMLIMKDMHGDWRKYNSSAEPDVLYCIFKFSIIN